LDVPREAVVLALGFSTATVEPVSRIPGAMVEM
jgi:hypothetical protein